MQRHGRSSLMRAAFAGDSEGVVELVKAEADLDLQDNVCDDMYVTIIVCSCVHILFCLHDLLIIMVNVV